MERNYWREIGGKKGKKSGQTKKRKQNKNNPEKNISLGLSFSLIWAIWVYFDYFWKELFENRLLFPAPFDFLGVFFSVPNHK